MLRISVMFSLFFEYSAEVKDYLVIAPWETLKRFVSGKEYDDIGFVVCFLIICEFENVVRCNIRLNY